MDITPEEAIEVNKEFGGHLRSDSCIRFAASHVTYTRSSYRKAAIWARAIAVDHPFSDANKRTAVYVFDAFIKIRDEEKITKAIINIAKENITDINKLVEMLKNANRRQR
ncbi:Fic family protein [Candidatus Woesearchaeota archaeon]|nr:Fic family protein [Candidatus Woesearchaeota archaeon]